MASTYSTNLAIELIGTGDQAGTWGITTNTNLGTLIEQAISGYVTQAVSTGNTTTITIPDGATGVARNMYIELTGTGGASTELVVPAKRKLYFIFNNTTGAVTVKVSGQTGVSVPAAAKVILVNNGTDVVEATTYIANNATSVSITNLNVTSGNITTLSSTNASLGSASITGANIASANVTNLVGTTLSYGSASITGANIASANITNLTGTTASYGSASITGANIASANIGLIYQPRFTSYRETVVNNTNAGGTVSIDLSQGNIFNYTLTSSGSLVISNAPSSGISLSFTVILLQGTGGSKTLTYPASVKFTDGVAPVLTTTAGKYDVLTFFTVDGGTTYFGAYAMANL